MQWFSKLETACCCQQKIQLGKWQEVSEREGALGIVGEKKGREGSSQEVCQIVLSQGGAWQSSLDMFNDLMMIWQQLGFFSQGIDLFSFLRFLSTFYSTMPPPPCSCYCHVNCITVKHHNKNNNFGTYLTFLKFFFLINPDGCSPFILKLPLCWSESCAPV